MKVPPNWKDRYREALYASTELKSHKAQRGLLDYLVHKAHSKLLMCWVSQREMAEVSGCNERNVKKLLVSLQMLGCWFSRGTEPVFPPRSEPPLSMVF